MHTCIILYDPPASCNTRRKAGPSSSAVARFNSGTSGAAFPTRTVPFGPSTGPYRCRPGVSLGTGPLLVRDTALYPRGHSRLKCPCGKVRNTKSGTASAPAKSSMKLRHVILFMAGLALTTLRDTLLPKLTSGGLRAKQMEMETP